MISSPGVLGGPASELGGRDESLDLGPLGVGQVGLMGSSGVDDPSMGHPFSTRFKAQEVANIG